MREILCAPHPYVASVRLDTFREVYSTGGYPAHWSAMTLDDQRLDAFHNARLVCRNVHDTRHDKKGMFVEGEIHLLYCKASDGSPANATPSEGNSRNVPIDLDDEATNPIPPKDSGLSETDDGCPRLLSHGRAGDSRLREWT